jgi:hypothetical protein
MDGLSCKIRLCTGAEQAVANGTAPDGAGLAGAADALVLMRSAMNRQKNANANATVCHGVAAARCTPATSACLITEEGFGAQQAVDVPVARDAARPVVAEPDVHWPLQLQRAGSGSQEGGSDAETPNTCFQM